MVDSGNGSWQKPGRVSMPRSKTKLLSKKCLKCSLSWLKTAECVTFLHWLIDNKKNCRKMMIMSSLPPLCYPPGFLPSYLLPAYEEVNDLPVMPPPPYTPLQSAPTSMDPAEESHCPTSVVHVPTDADVALPVSVEVLSHVHSTYNPNKDLTPGRYRRFTGDSGIEVCDGQELLDQHGLTEREEETEEEGTKQMEGAYNPQPSGDGHIDDATTHDSTAEDREQQSLISSCETDLCSSHWCNIKPLAFRGLDCLYSKRIIF